eukprot:TRINITY_DN10619_c0_g1_i1.p1 TRINITY_DN10619_c0_g1~~TRINITY_DN10619_c0_g1_i1.p1  ORF type:complete len:249 (-),score=33.97 TRINITY_DN10619_c0_g1_i1:40-750(-)
MSSENADIFCFNETKCSPISENHYRGYYSYFYPAEKAGYSGVGLITKLKPLSLQKGIGVEEHDREGRCITAEYDTFYLVVCYVPNSGAKGEGGWPKDLQSRIEWDKEFQNYLTTLKQKKPIILCGDLNVAHTSIDLANPDKNKKTAGYTPEEREGFTKLLQSGFTNVHRHFYPDKKNEYTFWSYRSKGAREKNIGWRLDYFVASNEFLPYIKRSFIRPFVTGSDHCPIGIHVDYNK